MILRAGLPEGSPTEEPTLAHVGCGLVRRVCRAVIDESPLTRRFVMERTTGIEPA